MKHDIIKTRDFFTLYSLSGSFKKERILSVTSFERMFVQKHMQTLTILKRAVKLNVGVIRLSSFSRYYLVPLDFPKVVL